jgi:uncharacterized membrane protein
LLSALAWGVGQIFLKAALTRSHPSVAYFVVSAVSICIVAGLAILTGTAQLAYLPLALALSLISCLGRVFYFRAAEEAPMSLVGTVVASYPMFTVILAAVFLGEVTTTVQRICIGLIIGGTLLMSWTPEDLGDRSVSLMSWFPISVLAALSFGVGGFLAKWGVVGADGLTFTLGATLNQMWISTAWLIMSGQARAWEWTGRGLPLLVVGGVFYATAFMSIFIALETGPSSLVFPISSGCTLVTLVLAYIILREKLTTLQWLGAVMASLGIIWIGWA